MGKVDNETKAKVTYLISRAKESVTDINDSLKFKDNQDQLAFMMLLGIRTAYASIAKGDFNCSKHAAAVLVKATDLAAYNLVDEQKTREVHPLAEGLFQA